MQPDYERLLNKAKTQALDYLNSIGDRHVFPTVSDLETLESQLDVDLPLHSSKSVSALEFLHTYGSPASVASSGPRYFGFVTGGTLPGVLAANWLATTWDQNCFGRRSGPGIALIESAAIRWLKQVLHLPIQSEGALVTGATMANFTCLAAARNSLLNTIGWDVRNDGLFGAPPITVLVGEEAHSTLPKVLNLLGFGKNKLVRLPIDSQGRIRISALPKVDGLAILCLQAGNVNSGAFDPAEQLIALAKEQNMWVHVDGAFGLWAQASAKLSHLCKGLEKCDSWATDAHKWLNVPYDCGAAFVKNPAHLKAAMSIDGAYLELGDKRESIDLSPDSSRRARAVDVWSALKILGRQGTAKMIENNCDQAKLFSDLLSKIGAEILNDVVLNQVLVAFGSDQMTKQVLNHVQNAGVCWCGSTQWKGRFAIRISVSCWATTDEDIRMSATSFKHAYAQLSE